MQLPNINTRIAKCLELGLFTRSMLAKFPDDPVLAALAAKLESAAAALAAAQRAVGEAATAQVVARVAVKHADHQADVAIRRLLRIVQAADGLLAGRLASQIFPAGITPIIRPVGASQLDEMRDLEGRLDAASSSWPNAAPEKATLVALRSQYEMALEERRVSAQKLADLTAMRDAAREDFLDVYAEVSGRIRAQFPRDAAKQNLFFDMVRATPRSTKGIPAPAPAPAPTPVPPHAA